LKSIHRFHQFLLVLVEIECYFTFYTMPTKLTTGPNRLIGASVLASCIRISLTNDTRFGLRLPRFCWRFVFR